MFSIFFAILVFFGSLFGAPQVDNSNFALGQKITPTVSASIPTVSLSISAAKQVPVIKVIDGDTLQILTKGETETVRVIGMDTPETVNPRRSVQCFGKEASDKARSLLTGQNVSLEVDPTQGERDKYGRLLRFVFLPDGTDFGKYMISEGYAHEYTYSVPYKYQTEYKNAENSARNNKKGLWADDACSASQLPTVNNRTSDTQSSVKTQTASQPSPSTYKPQGSYSCDCTKLCSQIKTCDEAYYQLNNCGCIKRDADGDGIPCESLCK